MSAPTQSSEAASVNGHVPDLHADPYFYGFREESRTNADGQSELVHIPLTAEDVLHPREDDFIMSNDAHRRNNHLLEDVLRWRVADVPRAIALFDHLIDFQVGDLKPLRPDAIVLLDSGPWDSHRGTYPVRDMGARLLCIVEVTSPSTRRMDLNDKIDAYGLGGVPLYVIADTIKVGNDYRLELREYRLTAGRLVLVATGAGHRVRLPAPLDLWLETDGDMLVIRDAAGTQLGTYATVAQRADEEKRRAEQEKQRAEQEKRRAGRQERRAEKEKQRAEQEKLRADEATRRLKELEDELRRLRGE